LEEENLEVGSVELGD